MEYARKIGLVVDFSPENLLELEYADGSSGWTSSVVRGVPWTMGHSKVLCDFHALDDLCVDLVLSSDYLFNMDVFTKHADGFFDIDSEEDVVRFLASVSSIVP